MAIIGCLGDIVFEVSEQTVRTLDNLQWSGSARWAVHNRHNYHALTEYTGMDPDRISFSMYLSSYLGVNPIDEIAKLWKYEREGMPVFLTIGEKGYGKYRWIIQNHKMSAESYMCGNVASCTVTVDLLEYIQS